MTSPVSGAGRPQPVPAAARRDDAHPQGNVPGFASFLDAYGEKPPKADFLGEDGEGVAGASPFNADGFFPHEQAAPIVSGAASPGEAAPPASAELEAALQALADEAHDAAGQSAGLPAASSLRSTFPRPTLPLRRHAEGIAAPASRQPAPSPSVAAGPCLPGSTIAANDTPENLPAVRARQGGEGRGGARLAVTIDGSFVRIAGFAPLSREEEERLAGKVRDLLSSHGLEASGISLNGRLLSPSTIHTASYKGQG